MSNRIESDRRRRPSLNTVLAFGRIRSPPRLAALCARVYSRVPLTIEYHSWYYRVGLAIRHCGFGRFTCPFSTINSHLFDRVKTNESLRPFSTSILTVRVSRPPNELSDRVGWVDGRRQRLVRLSRRYENNRSWRRWKIAGFSTAISTRYGCLSRREGRVHAAIGAGPNRFREGKKQRIWPSRFFLFPGNLFPLGFVVDVNGFTSAPETADTEVTAASLLSRRRSPRPIRSVRVG